MILCDTQIISKKIYSNFRIIQILQTENSNDLCKKEAKIRRMVTTPLKTIVLMSRSRKNCYVT